MSKPPLPDDSVAMLRKPNPSVITTLRRDGQPVSVATWYLWEDDGRVLINMDAGRVRVKHVRNDPRVTLSVLDSEDWYTHISLIGRVVDLRDDEGLTDIDRLAGHYLGKPYPDRERARVSGWIEVDRWHGWGTHKDNDQPG
ncbi:PPOX class F420-dependent oxidoreductase [Pseudonocardia sp. KRD291]|uniref:PPOX class F420-dependent oxidoreductase n=1 Tax=Pseudonocardia sp. KRD291 TaxID=2792007 RepID=UPI001C4A5CF3|nr:PPOX class F420-dependent oxidoreductase [Pseudonocardia sp. KRD291]MBW0104222.1 PPOX class F420-dependent oxidoreductase [Pseudonocardia sp. KRD291]